MPMKASLLVCESRKGVTSKLRVERSAPMLGPWISVGGGKGDSAPKDSYTSAALAKAAMLMPVSMDLYSVFKDWG